MGQGIIITRSMPDDGGSMSNRRAPPGEAKMSLAGSAEAVPIDRLFLGIFPDKAAQSAIEKVVRNLSREYALHGSPLRASRYHVTVHHLGDYAGLSPDICAAALAAIARIGASALDITLDQAASFEARHLHPFVLRCAEAETNVHALWRDSRMHLANAGFSNWLQPDFTPHLTLLYDERLIVVPVPIEPISWRVREVVLVHSLLGKTEYRFLGTARLR
jgi:RNA 2',3'-cyclic 3'-phosphodiesterase